ncbi:helix-turn-helix domain-containing protein [Ahrensia marina]|uniref:helix-turn-helix domain-containing protein n=1 Tax=Ahrensia marina TaxID=1514904 RepID=UPI0035D125F6
MPVSFFPAVSQYRDKDSISASRAQGTAPFGAGDARHLRTDGLIQARTRNVEACVALVFGVRHESLRASTRGKADVARARQVAMYLCHTTLGFSLTTVGDLFDRDRTTVSHACRVVEDLRDVSDFDARLSYLEHTVLAGCIAAPQPISTPAWERARG